MRQGIALPLLATSFLFLLAGAAAAQKLALAAPAPTGLIACDLPHVEHDWDFGISAHDFTTTACAAEGVHTWEYGNDPHYPEITVWGTRIGFEYPDGAGESLQTPYFAVTEQSYLLEIEHWYSMEGWYDGGNVAVDETVLTPIGGYPADEISPSEVNDPFCVDLEPGFTGFSNWRQDCFDLSPYLGQTIRVSFDFGSDNSVTDDGWFIRAVRVGGRPPVATDAATWGTLKALYR